MYKDKNGNYLTERGVVKDNCDRYWYVEEITSERNTTDPKIKCRNGCTFCYWNASDVEVVWPLYILYKLLTTV